MKQELNNSRNTPAGFREVFIHLFVPDDTPPYISIFLGIITLIALVLRLYIINNPIGYDEAYTFINFSAKSIKFVLADYHAPNNHILNSLMIWVAYRILGDHTWVVRVPAFIASVLSVPVAYVTARRFFNPALALTASAVLAITSDLVNEAANGRGYPMVILFSLLLANFAGILVKKQDRWTLAAYAVTGALGFYSIPIFLYPMAGISLWVAATYLINDEPWKDRWSKLQTFLLTCLASGILTFVLYSPVIFFGTGLESLIANKFVASKTWVEFTDNFATRSKLTWNSWITYTSPLIKQTLIGGFVLSLLFYRKVSNQKLPMQVSLVLGAGIMLVLQRVAPLERMWSYLEALYLIFAVVGLAWLIFISAKALANEKTAMKIVSSLVLLFVITSFIRTTVTTQNRQAVLDRTIAPEQFAGEYIAKHITAKDTVIAVSPVDLQTAYYMKINGVSYDVFYQRDHPVQIQNALVVVRTRGDAKHKSLQSILEFYKLTSALNIEAAEMVFEYGPVQIYSVPSK
ncbi:MAG: glycosyltransferase family 39 protein [Anaerolineales bacterium]|nr:glycosyltransferase family 39 protein [Anaerolineales bacterium]